MTISSEISRLQIDKEAMRQAIIEKGVDVAASVSFDDYAACILAIQTPPKKYIDFLLIGGGGGGGSNSSYSYYGGGGGGGGGAIECFCYNIKSSNYTIKIGGGGARNQPGGNTCLGDIIAYGGGAGVDGAERSYTTCDGASGGGGATGAGGNTPGCAIYGGQGYNGGNGYGNGISAGGGGGAGGAGCDGYVASDWSGWGGNGGIGIQSCMSGQLCYYGGGGGGGSVYGGQGSGGLGGGGTGGAGGATYYGGGGGGSAIMRNGYGGDGYQGIVIIRYKTDGTCGISNATGGCKYTCGNYTIHCFTSDGTFTIVS